MQTEALRNLVAKIQHLQCEMQTVELKAPTRAVLHVYTIHCRALPIRTRAALSCSA